MEIKFKLMQALTAYDRRQSKTKHWNPNALGIYFQRVNEVCADIAAGAKVRDAILAGFNDRVLDVCLRAVGQPEATRAEAQGGTMVYQPHGGNQA